MFFYDKKRFKVHLLPVPIVRVFIWISRCWNWFLQEATKKHNEHELVWTQFLCGDKVLEVDSIKLNERLFVFWLSRKGKVDVETAFLRRRSRANRI